MNIRLFIRKNSIFVAIALTIFLISFSSLLTFLGKSEAVSFNRTKEQIERTKDKISNMFLYMGEMDKGIRGYLITPDEKFKTPYKGAGLSFPANADTLRALLEEQRFPHMDEFVKSDQALSGYYDLLQNILDLQEQGNTEAALAIYNEDPGLKVWEIWFEFSTKALAFEQARYEEAKLRYESLLKLASTMQLLLLFVGIPTLLFVIYRLRRSTRQRTQIFADLLQSQRQYLFAHQEEVAQADEKTVINRLIQSLEQAAAFIKQIAQGNYAVDWQGLNQDNQADNQNNLAGALIRMREQMKIVKQENQQRLWTTEGLSKVAEITRTHQKDVEELADRLLSYLVNYTEANQGSLFFLQDDLLGEVSLSLSACYAYDKKKHAEKTVKPGQGLVGQTFLEKKTLHLKRVPSDYVQITSGLGEATPTALLVVPLTFNEQVLGILEIASFNQFAAHQIKFLETVGEVIASAVATVRMNAQTKQLLTQSQEDTEALRAQEEEMRQNMEELQATQEEMQRKAQEYETVIAQQKETIERFTQTN
ncbi:MAG: GAF domain-containing protein [Tunicatimonas sp.]